MGDKKFYKFFRTLFKPFKLIHYRLTIPHPKVQDTITSWISFFSVVFIIIRCYPYNGIADFLFTIFAAFIIACVCALGIAFVFPYIIKAISMIFCIPALLYDICDDKINNVSREKGGKIKEGPRAEVGIKYFIEREKRIQINHAKYLG